MQRERVIVFLFVSEELWFLKIEGDESRGGGGSWVMDGWKSAEWQNQF